MKKLVVALNGEYKHRYCKIVDHKSFTVAKKLLEPKLPNLGLTAFFQAMPDEFRVPGDPIKAYRNYYVYGKKNIAKWSRRRVPTWFKEHAKEKQNVTQLF